MPKEKEVALPPLFKKTQTGAILVYLVEASKGIITVTQGHQHGVKQNYHTICKPKNLGKSNETDKEEQAVIEAKAKWAKKVKKGYTIDPAGEPTVYLPMKVKNFKHHKDKIIFPCYESPKLNGINSEYRLVDKELVHLSRGGERLPIPPHQVDEILKTLQILGVKKINGEQYIHGEHLQDIQSAVTKPNELSKKLVFCLFESPDMEGDYSTKEAKLTSILHFKSVKSIPATIVHSFEEIESHYQYYLSKGYEGSIIRNFRCKYKYNSTSSDAFKLKPVMDAEFLVVAFDLDKYKHAVFTCTTGGPNGDEVFRVKLKGTNEERLIMAGEADKYIGKWLKVEFEMYSKNGNPLKPVGLHFRKCNEQGEPLE